MMLHGKACNLRLAGGVVLVLLAAGRGHAELTACGRPYGPLPAYGPPPLFWEEEPGVRRSTFPSPPLSPQATPSPYPTSTRSNSIDNSWDEGRLVVNQAPPKNGPGHLTLVIRRSAFPGYNYVDWEQLNK